MGKNSCSSCAGTGSVSEILLCLDQMIRGGCIIVCEISVLMQKVCSGCNGSRQSPDNESCNKCDYSGHEK